MVSAVARPFHIERLGVIMEPRPEHPDEAFGTLNPGGARGPDGHYYLFPRLVAANNYSRIGRARVLFDSGGRPTGVVRLGYALEPQEPYEVSELGGGVEDPRVTFIQPLGVYAMTYTAYAPGRGRTARIALAVSYDLISWTRLGLLRYLGESGGQDLNACSNKDGAIFPEAVADRQGRPSIAIMHRPSFAITWDAAGGELVMPPSGAEYRENMWISYVPLDAAARDLRQLTEVSGHRPLMVSQAAWEHLKIGAGPPPVRLPYGWLVLYHAVSTGHVNGTSHRRYLVGAAILDLEDPTRILYRCPEPLMEPRTPYERSGVVSDVVFPTAMDQREPHCLDVYYGAADSTIGVARLMVPDALPGLASAGVGRERGGKARVQSVA